MPSDSSIQDFKVGFWNSEIDSASSASQQNNDCLSHRCVLVTGAGGSIGAALCARISTLGIRRLVLLDSSENALYEVDRKLRQVSPCIDFVAVLGGVTDESLLSTIFEQHSPEVIFHAAAFKHVPLLEQNPFAAVSNNVLGTWALARIAEFHGAEHLILVSTDKAADPISLMGASKRIAELIVLAFGVGGATCMRAVRLGNVLGSKGSVGPLFVEQIARGGPVTVTHPEVRRYFITIDLAAEALLSAVGVDCSASILVPQMDPQTRIEEVARRIIRELGAESSGVQIEFTALRPGDKMEEVLISGEETWMSEDSVHGSTIPLRGVQSPGIDRKTLAAAMDRLRESLRQRDGSGMMQIMLRLVPGYLPTSELLERAGRSERSAEVLQA